MGGKEESSRNAVVTRRSPSLAITFVPFVGYFVGLRYSRFLSIWYNADIACSGAEKRAALADLPGQWIDAVHQRRQPKVIALDMDSRDSPTYGEQEVALTTAISGAPAIIRSSCSTSLAIWSAAPCGPETSIRLMAGGRFWSLSCRATGAE